MQWGALFVVTEGCGTRLSTRTLGGCSLLLLEPICLCLTCGSFRPHPFDGQWQRTGPQAPCSLWSTLSSRVNSWEPKCIGIRNSLSWGERHSINYRPTAALQHVLSTDKNHLRGFLSQMEEKGNYHVSLCQAWVHISVPSCSFHGSQLLHTPVPLYFIPVLSLSPL